MNEISKNLIDEETGEVKFDAHSFNQRVEDTLYRNDILISKKTEIRTGMFYNQTKQKKGLIGLPLKGNMDTELYGSYTRINPAYAVMLQFEKKNVIYKRIVGVPIYYVHRSKDELYQYFRRILKLNEDSKCMITSNPIPFYSYLNWDNQICYLIGASNKVEVCNAKEFYYDKKFYKEHKYVLNQLFHQTKNKINEEDYDGGLNHIIQYIIKKIDTEYVLFQNLMDQLNDIVNLEHLEIYSIKQKEQIIKELTKLLNCKSDNANFKFLSSSYSSAFGKKHDRMIENAIIINKSVTGVKEQKYEF